MTITRNTPWRDVGDVYYETWQSVTKSYGAPAEVQSVAAWAAAMPHSALALAQGIAESSLATDFAANPKSNKNMFNMKGSGPGGYVKFDSWADGIKGWRERITSSDYKDGIYRKTVTIKDLVYVFAPPFENDSDGYINRLVAFFNKWLPNWTPPVTTPSTPPEPIPGEQEPPVTLEILNRVIGVQRNAPATLLNRGPKSAVPIIHNTSNTSAGADALMHASFVANGGGEGNVSFHFAVDSKRAVQILPLNRIGYHASDGCDNRDTDVGCFNGIAFENCDNRDGDIRKTFDNQAELLACIEFGDSRIDYGGRPLTDFEGFIDRTLGHHDTAYDGKWCPEDYLNLFGNPGYKVQLKALAHAKLAAKRGGTTPPPSNTYVDAHPVEKGSRVINEHVFLAPGGKTFQKQTTPREYGDPGAKATGPDIAKGTKITQANISHYVVGTGDVPNIWLVLTGVENVKDGSRVPAENLISDAA